MPELPPVVGLLLAAGTGRRFGADKLLLPLADGLPLAVHACRGLCAGTDRVIAVIRPGNPELAGLLGGEGATVTVCAAADRGMGASLAHGIGESPTARGWLVALADMPWIAPATIAAVAAALRAGAPLAAPVYRGRRGHPVGFAAELREALLALDGDEGAKAVLAAHRSRLHLLDCEDPGILRDVDTPEDMPNRAD